MSARSSKCCRIIIAVIAAAISAIGQDHQPCSQPILKKPSAYPKESELYYLAWMEHGRPGQNALASQAILELENKSEYDITRKLWECTKDDLLKHVFLFSMFDQRPAKHAAELQKLIPDWKHTSSLSRPGMLTLWLPGPGGGSKLESLDGFVPAPYTEAVRTGRAYLRLVYKDNAAARLIKAGYLSEDAFTTVLRLAYPGNVFGDWKTAKEVFELFDGIPQLDPPVAKPIDGREESELSSEFNDLASRQFVKIEKVRDWFRKNKKKLAWDPSQKRYVIH